MSNNTYDILKKISLIFGYVATFVFTMSDIWGWGEYGTEIAASVSALGILLGSILSASSAKYWQQIDEGGDDE